MSSHSEPTLPVQTPKGGRGGGRNRPKNISANVININNSSSPVRSHAVNVPHHPQQPNKHNHHHHQKASRDIINAPAPQRAPKDFITPPQSPVERHHHHQPQKDSNRKPRRRNNNQNKGKPRDVNTEIQNEIKESAVNQGYESPSSSSNEESARTPRTPGLGTPNKAYAGPNFHSSPNPSSLPMPSWFANKAMPVTPTAGSNLQAMLDMSGQETMSQSLEETTFTLDKLFQAHKQEKARLAQGSQVSQPPSPVSARLSPVNQDTSFNDVFTMELEGRKPSPNPLAIPSTPPAVESKPVASPVSPPTSVKKPASSDARTQTALKSFLSNPFALSKPIAIEAKDAKPTRPAAPMHTKSASATLITTPPRNNYKRNNHHQQQQQQSQISLITSHGSPAPRRFNNPYQQSYQQATSSRVQTAINLFPSVPPAVPSPVQSSTGLEDHLRAALRLPSAVQVQTAAAS